MRKPFRQLLRQGIFLLFLASLFVPLFDAQAFKQLSIEPITWNVIGLDSNNVNVGPNHFPIGARVCNTGDELVENVKSSFVFDSSDSYIYLRPGTDSDYTDDGIDLDPTECVDFYYEVEVDRNSNAYEHTREYHITAWADSTAAVSTPQPRELFVEYLISQSRNSVSDVLLDGVSVPAGGTMNLVVGQTYEITLVGSTATNGYEQIESFINFPNTIFQVLDVTTAYSADTSGYVPNPDDRLYGDGCLWENDPDNPNYRSCLATGKVGGSISVVFNVRVLSVPSNPLSNPQGLSTLIYDFSGSSYHYNSDFSVSTRYANIVTATLTKAFTPKTIHPGDDSTLSFEITNPGESAISNVNFTDPLPSGIAISSTTVSYAGCGSPTPASLTVGQTDLDFSNITVAGLGTCTIDVTVSGSVDGVYQNISENLFIDTFDTSSSADDTLVISSRPAGPSSCAVPVTMATWTMPTSGQGSGGPPPPYTTIDGDVSSATTSASLTGAGSQSISTAGVTTNAWQITDAWNDVVGAPSPSAAPYFEFAVDSWNYGGVVISFQYDLETNGQWAANNNNTVYVYSSTDGTNFNLAGSFAASKGSWQPAVSATAAVTGPATTYFRIMAVTRGNQATSSVLLDNITITGCPRPDPPTLSKAFTDSSIPTGTTTTLTFTFANPNSSQLTNVGFSDELPTGLLIASPNGLAQSCSPGTLTGETITATPGTTSFSMSGGTLSANTSCTISIDVLGDVAGQYQNISDSITSDETGYNTDSTGYGVDSLTVVDPPVISKSFGTTYVLTGNTTSLSFSISNPNPSVALNGVAVTDVLPAGLSVADGTFSVCGGTDNLTTTAASRTIQLTDGTIAAGDSCEFSVTVTGSSVGTHVNTTGSVTSTNGGTGNTATATLDVRDSTPDISLLKLVSDSSSGPWGPFLSVGTSSNVYFRFVVENTGDEELTSVNVTDPAPYVDPSTCVWTDGNGVGLSAPFTLPVASGPLDSHIAYCTIGPITSSATVGSYSNTATASGTGDSTTVTDDSTATYANPEVTIVKSADPAYFLAAGEVIDYTFVVTNTGGVSLLGPVTLDDDRATDESCPSVTTVGDGDNYLDPADHPDPGDPAESITCTASYTIMAGDVTAGAVTNTASATIDSITSNTDDETVYLAALTIDKDTSTPTVGANGLVVYTIEVVNTGQYDLTNFQVTDTLPFNGGEYSIQSVSASVTSGTITPNGSYDGSGDTNLLAGTDTFVAGATATITINIQLNGATAATYDNTAVAVTDQTGSIDDDGLVADDPGTPGSGADPEADEDVTVTAGGTITIIKDAVPDDAQDFAFTGTGPASYDFAGGFSLDDDSDGTLPNTQSFTGLSPGSYSLTEGLVSGWGLTGLICVDPDSGSSVDLGARTATIDLDDGETVTCTYTNTQLGTIVIVKNAVPDDAQDFDFTGTGPSGYDFGGGFSLDDDADGTLPNSQTFVNLLPGSYTVIEGTVSGWNLTALSCSDPDSGSSGNVGTLTATIDLDAGETVTCTFTNTQDVPSYSITKTVTDVGGDGASGSVDEAGDVISYQVVVANTGNQTITGVSLSDSLVAPVGSPAESISNNGQLDIGETWTWTYTYTANQDDIDNNGGGDGDIDNTATVSSNELGDQSDSQAVPVVQNASYSITKTVTDVGGDGASGSVDEAGDVISYQVVVANTGNQTITGVSLADSLVAVVGPPTESITADGNLEFGETWTWTYTYSATQSDIDNNGGGDGDIDNTATVSSNEVGNQADSQAVPISQNAALNITKEVSDDNATWVNSVSILVGDTVYYRVQVENTGNTTLTGLSVTDPACTLTRGLDISGDNDADFEPTEIWAYYCNLTAVAGTQTNTATADSNETGPDTDTADYTGIAPPQISKVFTPGAINAGDVSTLTFTITNPNASTDFTGVQFNDTFPITPGLLVVATPANASSSCGGSVIAGSGAGLISFSGGAIPAGGTCTVQVDVTTSVEGVYINTSGNVSAANGGVGNQASAVLDVGAALVRDPAITKTGNPAAAQVGDTVTFTLTIVNNGDADALDVVVTDPLPVFLNHVLTTAPGAALIDYDLPSNTVTVYYDTVQPTDTFTITITTVVNSLGSPPGGINTATVSSLTTDAEPANNVDSTFIEIVEVSGLPSPDTGFAPGQITSIPARPEGFAYFKLGELTLRIPALELETTIVGVPLTEEGWDVTWLWNQVGYLDGTAFPGWNGNTVLTGHVYLPNGLPGPFVGLEQLAWGDQVIVEVFGTRYIYEVRESLLYSPGDSRIIRHEQSPWLSLITCQGFNEQTGEYRWRRVVRAVLISAQEIE